MIAITNESGLSLVLDPQQQLMLEQATGWLVDDQLPGAKSYPIAFPVEPNERFLSSGYRLDQARPRMELIVHVRLMGVMFRRCRLNYRIVSGKGSGYLKYDGGEVFSQLRKLSLQEALTDAVSLGTSPLEGLASRMKTIASLPPGQFPCTFFPIRNELFFEESLSAATLPGFVRQPYINAWKGSNFLVDSATVKGYPVSPQFYLWWVLEQLFARAGYRIDGDWIGQPEVQRLVILNQTAMQTRRVGIVDLTPLTVQPGQHLPAMSVGDFLKAIRQGLGLIFSFDGNRQVVTIRQFTDVVRSPAVDLSPYMVDRYGVDAPASKGVRIIDQVDANDELFRDKDGNQLPPSSIVLGGTAEGERDEVQLGIAATQLTYEPAPDGGHWIVPTLRQPGNMLDPYYKPSDRYPNEPGLGQTGLQLKNAIALRLVSYRGLVPGSNSLTYPLGTTDVRSGAQVVIGTSATRLRGRYGRYRQLLRHLFYFRDQTRLVTVPMNFPVGVLTGVKLHEPIALKLTSQARRSFLIDKLQAESPGPDGIMPCTLTCLTIPDGLDLEPLVDEEPVWVELIKGPARPVNVAVSGRVVSRILVTLTIKVWTTSTRTVPAVVTNLPVTLRLKSYQVYGGSQTGQTQYHEYPITYLVNGSSTVVEADFIQTESDTSSLANNLLTQSMQIDPGDDYLILV
ncbi:hypothetical protein [Spirosoma sordidisoli]|uniref:Uncharacterized protein n=1 Tax=Spirosoma sordidisoli TaxID=2502893 RepID=A0A4Q2UPL2_9BACT|nr:hypothetical protein [Spirosoma sordidisoli]RYC69741.1 hypothetical protein EQG79_14190 [Spirosoma sordidisoli]